MTNARGPSAAQRAAAAPSIAVVPPPTVPLADRVELLNMQREQFAEKVRKIQGQLGSRIDDGTRGFRVWRSKATWALTCAQQALAEINAQLKPLNVQMSKASENSYVKVLRAMLGKWLNDHEMESAQPPCQCPLCAETRKVLE